MKKFLAIILTLTLVLSMSVTAFADDQTVSVSIPGYDYTVTIPADCSIEYGNTGIQSLGKIKVASTDWETLKNNKKAVYVCISSTSGNLVNQNGRTIPYVVGYLARHENYSELMGNDFSCQDTNERNEYGIRVSDWSGAEPGTTYSTIITYNISLMDTWW